MNAAKIHDSRGLGGGIPWGKTAMIRSVIFAAVLMVLIAVAAKAAFCQSNRDLSKTSS